MKVYIAVLQTIIAIALCAIVAKLYSPQADAIGVHIGAPTVGDLRQLGKMTDVGDRKREVTKALYDRVPLTQIDGEVSISQPVEISGEVSIDGPVQVSGEVSIDGPVETYR